MWVSYLRNCWFDCLETSCEYTLIRFAYAHRLIEYSAVSLCRYSCSKNRGYMRNFSITDSCPVYAKLYWPKWLYTVYGHAYFTPYAAFCTFCYLLSLLCLKAIYDMRLVRKSSCSLCMAYWCVSCKGPGRYITEIRIQSHRMYIRCDGAYRFAYTCLASLKCSTFRFPVKFIDRRNGLNCKFSSSAVEILRNTWYCF